jgi:SAM-dependent methyltransferase
MWNENAEAWASLARRGYDIFRDYVNTPAFLDMLPDLTGLDGVDIGCGEGHNTRLIRSRGARMIALDVSQVFLAHAAGEERARPAGIRYLCASAVDLPFGSGSFDFTVATMSLMDMPDHEKAISEIHRILKPGGFLQFSITHPCFQTARWKYVYDQNGRVVAVECGDYFSPPAGEIEEWGFSNVPPEVSRDYKNFQIPVFRRTLSSWLNLLIDAGFDLEAFREPSADEQAVKKYPALAVTRTIAFFLIIRCRKKI